MNEIDWLDDAINYSRFSVDPSVQNGAILVNPYQGSIIGSGYNGLTIGTNPTKDKWERPAKYMWVEHAERNAIYNAAYMGNSTHGSTMYCPWAACADCARAIVQAGVKKLVRLETLEADGWQDSIQIGEQILINGGVEIVEYRLEDVIVPDGIRLGQFREV